MSGEVQAAIGGRSCSDINGEAGDNGEYCSFLSFNTHHLSPFFVSFQFNASRLLQFTTNSRQDRQMKQEFAVDASPKSSVGMLISLAAWLRGSFRLTAFFALGRSHSKPEHTSQIASLKTRQPPRGQQTGYHGRPRRCIAGAGAARTS